ncbi:MAG: multicomponent Na+:H+ antiporter subunit E [Spirochaetes bacterium]|nr:MAG: multicomponent Na+:H+ antiporter subunit E [Spirochaetota bacterium]
MRIGIAKDIFLTSTILFAVWIVFTSDISLFSLSAGIVSSLCLGFLGHTIFISHRDTSFKHILPHPVRLILYLLRLIVEMYHSSGKVFQAVWKREDRSRIISFRTSLESDIGRLILANSITFTPGTITLELKDDQCIVHWFIALPISDQEAEKKVKGILESSLGKAVL